MGLSEDLSCLEVEFLKLLIARAEGLLLGVGVVAVEEVFDGEGACVFVLPVADADCLFTATVNEGTYENTPRCEKRCLMTRWT